MVNVIVGAFLGMCFFIIPILAYREGVRLGMQINKGIEPPKLKNPITIAKEIKQEYEQSKEDKKYQNKLDRLLNYTGDLEEEHQ
jgi:hypothetical protein